MQCYSVTILHYALYKRRMTQIMPTAAIINNSQITVNYLVQLLPKFSYSSKIIEKCYSSEGQHDRRQDGLCTIEAEKHVNTWHDMPNYRSHRCKPHSNTVQCKWKQYIRTIIVFQHSWNQWNVVIMWCRHCDVTECYLIACRAAVLLTVKFAGDVCDRAL